MSKEKEAKQETLQEVEKPTVESSIEALKTQLKEYAEKAEYFKTMTHKAEGALEVLMQLKDDNGES
jgi:hypothetical protein|tara:strand:+ start:814 stop:1011 length:198 start_codon:yes stop_codon:yes gene_type:complete